jgi:alpha,alpha-trehalose phosphorylase
MDGVVTRTADLHAAAWKSLFDAFLAARAKATGEPYEPFDADTDYRAYVDGKPRLAGVRSFLSVRGIALPEGEPGDSPEADTVNGLGKRKDALFERALEERGVELFDSTIELIKALRAAGVRVGAVTSSRHGREILERAGIERLFDARLDGIDIDDLALAGKPAPDAFVCCAERLGTTPARAVVVEDAVAGVAAGRAGNFGLVIGVDRGGNRAALERNGADVVVEDLGELDLPALDARFAEAGRRATWRIEQEGFDPGRERGVESIFTLGNGYLGVRGALEAALPSSEGDLLIAGLYDRKQAGLPYSEREFLDPDRGDYPYSEIVTLPFPFRLALAVDGMPLTLVDSGWSSHRRVLDMHRGTLEGETVFEPGSGRCVNLQTRRAASLDDRHLLLQSVVVRLDNHSGSVELDVSTGDPDLDAHHPHLDALPAEPDGPGIELHRFRTKTSNFEVAIAARTTLIGSGREQLRFAERATIGEPLEFRRCIAVYTSRDVADPAAAALERIKRWSWDDFDPAFEAHAAAWRRIWESADIRVAGSPAVEQALRFHVYHLSSAADHDPKVSVGGRALTGRAYEGHVFWDVEIFLLPFFLHTQPDVARNLLLYRHATLDGARRRAAEMGHPGACYAWESTVTGADVTPRQIVLRTSQKVIPIFTGTQQIHVTADVAHGVWRYWQATRDEDFLHAEGAEILAETARFWAGRVELEGDRYHIRTVVGPDEYHHGVDDNAYTNWMARFNLEKAAWTWARLAERAPRAHAELAERLHLGAEELEQWRDVARRLYCPQPNADGIIEQFAGFFDLGDYPLPAEERFKAPIERLFDWDKINGLKVIKQADVLMLPFLFPERFSDEIVAANYHYYEPLTDHGSSLSPAVHAGLAARIGLDAQADKYWRQSLTLDLENLMGNSALGVHPACMAATWQALVFELLGVRFGESGPEAAAAAAARLPEKWRSVELRLAWRDRTYPIEVAR